MKKLLAYLSRLFTRQGHNHQSARLPLPHEAWPEILHWQAGDKFDAHVDYQGKHYYNLRLISLTDNGFAYCQEADQRVKIGILSLIGHNNSVITREVNEELKIGSEYMELIEQFNKSYAELQERDKKLKLVS